MKYINIRELRKKEVLDDLPAIVTRYGKPVATILPHDYKPVSDKLVKREFSSAKSITNPVMEGIASSYDVPLAFVQDCWDTAKNWLDSKGQTRKDYRAFLSNWVKRERASWILKKRGRGGVVDARK